MLAAVTGGTGFIGRHLVAGLLAEGFAVRILTRRPGKAETLWPRDRVQLVAGGLDQADSLTCLVEDASIVFHLAGEIRDQARFQVVNVDGTRNLLQACRDKNIARFVHLSSVGVMGARKSGAVDESYPCRPRNAYETSKLEGERAVSEAYKEHGLPVAIARPTIVFGPGIKSGSDSLAAWLRAIKRGVFRYVGHGGYAANYVYVSDVVAALLLLSRHESSVGRTLIISDSCDLRSFVDHAASAMGTAVPGTIPYWLAWCAACGLELAGRIGRFNPPLNFARVEALTSRTRYSGDLISRDLDFRPPIGWQSGLDQTIQWYQREGLL